MTIHSQPEVGNKEKSLRTTGQLQDWQVNREINSTCTNAAKRVYKTFHYTLSPEDSYDF